MTSHSSVSVQSCLGRPIHLLRFRGGADVCLPNSCLGSIPKCALPYDEEFADRCDAAKGDIDKAVVS